jgi:hypothetical protein
MLFAGAGVAVGVGGTGTTLVEFNVRDWPIKVIKRRAAINNSNFFTTGMYSLARQLSINLTSEFSLDF